MPSNIARVTHYCYNTIVWNSTIEVAVLQTVVYQGKAYKVVHKYNSGYWEIGDVKNFYNIILVNSTELTIISDKERAGIK